MAEPPRHPNTGDERETPPDVEPPPGTPLWVKVFGVIALVVVVVFVMLLLTGGHGPARHSVGSDSVHRTWAGHGIRAE